MEVKEKFFQIRFPMGLRSMLPNGTLFVSRR